MQGEVSHSSGFEVGQVVAGSYRVRGVLGSGGMGDVLDATQLALNRPVAIKVMKSPATSHPTSVRRFLREARITASLGSGTAASIYDAGRLESGEPYIVMERLLGRDLGALLEECGWLPPRHAAWLLLRAVEALAPAHRAGMVHRDIKPENLFLVRDSRIGELTVKVIDFGVARIIGDEEADSDDRGAMLGTPHYMAPEQIRSSREADARSDIWSLGVTAYELLTGELPFDG